ncbi:MAG TPA: hypothetical protein VFE72_08795 [Lysobacter sp.]|nr:hypothetical protein [Lysobacter sp.]
MAGKDSTMPGSGVLGTGSDPGRQNTARLRYGLQRGHRDYCDRARVLDGMYLGAGRQWDEDDRIEVEENQGRKAIEMNEVADAVNTALGNQIQNRVDIAYRPRGMGADDDTATSLSKVAMQIADNNDYQHKESDAYADGLIQQRGYLELMLDFDQNVRGEIRINTLDPMDVIPDPDAREYDPDSWADVIVLRWATLDELEALFGKAKRRKVEAYVRGNASNEIEGEEGEGIERSKFGDGSAGDYYDMMSLEQSGTTRVRLIDRQFWQLVNTRVAVFPSGDIRVIEDATPAQVNQILRQGGMVFSRPMKRVRWVVSTINDIVLHDDWSPFKHFTVVPFFPYFRRGQTRGLVDNMVGPQELLNKALSQYLHIINTTANSGWIVEANSLVDMTIDDLEDEGAKTGLVVHYRKGSTKPEKIQANSVPTGIDKLAEMASAKIRVVSGVSDALRGKAPGSQSGVAIQSLQFGSQLSLAVPLDNLARTRHMLAGRLLEYIQGFMTEAQLLRITERGADGSQVSTEMPINWEQEDGSILNDLTMGEYDVVVTEQPSQVTFQNSQFEQAMAMRKEGIAIPDDVVLRYSTLADKNEVIKAMQDSAQKANPNDEAKAALDQAKAVMARLEGLFAAIRTAQALRGDPALAGVADVLARSAGFQDQDGGETYPDTSGLPPAAAPPTSTNPLTPDNPQTGASAGMTAVEAVPA